MTSPPGFRFRREQINTTETIDIHGITIPAATMPLRSTKYTCIIITILFKYPSCLAWFYLLCTRIKLNKNLNTYDKNSCEYGKYMSKGGIGLSVCKLIVWSCSDFSVVMTAFVD